MPINLNFKEFANLSVEKRHFGLRWDSSLKFLLLPKPSENHYSRNRYDKLPTGVLVDNFKLLYRK